jgi:8-oxo-dGTP pyrophosphatase MutT (NUDIX family)
MGPDVPPLLADAPRLMASEPTASRETLRARLAALPVDRGVAPGWVGGDEGAATHEGRRPERPIPAAVLVGMVDQAGGPAVLLTQRTDHLRDHAGQISLPGGRIERKDPSIAAAALREAEEEIGLAPDKVEVLGELTPYHTITGFRIHPVIGWIEPPLRLRLDRFEVADVFEVPLHFLVDPANHRRQSYRRGRLTRAYYVLPWQGRFIWGATAGILVNLSRLLRTPVTAEDTDR